MRNIEHRLSFRSKLHHPFDQTLSVRLRQDRRRLIKDHDFAGMDESPSYLRQPQWGTLRLDVLVSGSKFAPTLARAA